MSFFVISDLKMNDAIAAKSLGKTTEEYNNFIIEKWNSTVEEEDTVFIFGSFAKGTKEEVKSLISKMRGSLFLCSYSENDNIGYFTWRTIGIKRIWGCSFTADVGEEKIFFPCKRELDNPYKYLAVTEKDNLNNVFENNKFSIEAKYWDYTPLRLKDLSDIILRLEEFSKMEV